MHDPTSVKAVVRRGGAHANMKHWGIARSRLRKRFCVKTQETRQSRASQHNVLKHVQDDRSENVVYNNNTTTDYEAHADPIDAFGNAVTVVSSIFQQHPQKLSQVPAMSSLSCLCLNL